MKNTISGITAQRALDIRPFIVMEILERAKAMEAQGERVIHMEIGEPDFKTPEAIKSAAAGALRADLTKYTHSLGLPELRAEIARFYHSKYRVNVEPEQVIVTTGTSAGMLLTFSALIDPGDEVVTTDPGYPCYPNFVRLVGGETVFVRLTDESGWQPTADAIQEKMTPLTKAVIVNSPSNPTGIIVSSRNLSDIAELAGPAALIVSDEIYHGMEYGEHAHCMLEFTERAIIVNGFSKLHAMTGWRLGYLIVPPELVRPIQKLQQNLFISAPTLSQYGALAALTDAGPEIDRMVAVYDERRQWLMPELERLGFRIAARPTGAFYVLADASHLNRDSYALALDILENAKVAVTPGIDFGPGAEGYIRFSYATSLENIREGCMRLETWLGGR